MKVLALDVSVKGCGVAFLDHGTGARACAFEDTERGQAEKLVPMIAEVMQDAGVPVTAIARIAVTRGPGSFTGVRIGLATARTLGMALDIPVFGFSTLDLALGKAADKNLLVVIDTKRGDFYGQTCDTPARIYTPDEVDAWQGELIKDRLPDLFLMAKMAAQIGEEGGGNYPAMPLYLREAETSRPKER